MRTLSGQRHRRLALVQRISCTHSSHHSSSPSSFCPFFFSEPYFVQALGKRWHGLHRTNKGPVLKRSVQLVLTLVRNKILSTLRPGSACSVYLDTVTPLLAMGWFDLPTPTSASMQRSAPSLFTDTVPGCRTRPTQRRRSSMASQSLSYHIPSPLLLFPLVRDAPPPPPRNSSPLLNLSLTAVHYFICSPLLSLTCDRVGQRAHPLVLAGAIFFVVASSLFAP